jgi:hypothetical protein
MNSILSDIITALIGTLTGAALAYWIALKQFKIQQESSDLRRRVDTALAFYDELTSDSFSKARTEASKILREHLMADSLNDFYGALSQEERRSILEVLSFFRRLQLVVEYGHIDNQMVIDLFSGEFIRWYFAWLDEIVPANWDTRKSIDKMNNWLKQNMSEEYEQKRIKAIEKRDQRIADFQQNG